MLREYCKADRDDAVGLYIDNFTNAPFNYNWLQEDRVYSYFCDMENTPGFKAFVYEHDGNTIGICLGQMQDYFACSAYEIKELLVARNSRGMGIGSKLLTAVENALAAAGVKLISLATDKNIPAYEFYQKNGYDASDSSVWMGKIIE